MIYYVKVCRAPCVVMMGVLVILVVSSYCILFINGLDITVCKNGSNFQSVNLNCSNNDMIHVESITYFYSGSSGCGSSTAPCGQPLTNSDTGLISSCTGQPSPCSQYIPNYSNCTKSTVNYRCIPRENGQDMCEINLTLKEDVTTKFLFSPHYPAVTSGFRANETRCECVIRGTNITSITILDLVLRTSSDGTRSNLFIQYGDMTYNKTSRENSQSTLQVYNHRLQTTTSTADIIFTHQQINGQKLWIEIQGVALAGSCNNISATNVSPTPSTPFTSPPQPDSTTTPSSTSTATHTSTIATSTENSIDPSTTSETSYVYPTTVNSTDFSTATYSNTSSGTPTEHQDNILLIVGCVVGGLILILVAVCVLVGIRRKKANVLQQNVHVHINNTTNNTTPDYFVLEGLNTQDEEVKHDNISTNPSSMTTGRAPEYAVVNNTGRGFNVADVNQPDQGTKSNDTGVSDMEILENDLYIPYEASSNPDDTGVVASITNNTTQHRPLGDIEIMENELYVPFEDSSVEVSKPTTSSVYDNAFNNGTKQNVTTPDMESMTKLNVATPNIEILENELYAPFKNAEEAVYDNASKAKTTPNDLPPMMEILENDLYVPFEKTQV